MGLQGTMRGQVRCWCWRSPQQGNVGMAPAVPGVSFPVVTRGFQGRAHHFCSLSAFAGLLGCMGTLHAEYTGNTPMNDPGVSTNHGDASWRNHCGKQCRGSACTLCRFSRIRLFVTLQTLLTWLLCPWDSPGKKAGVRCCTLLPDAGIKPAYPTTPSLQVDSLTLSHQGSPQRGSLKD